MGQESSNLIDDDVKPETLQDRSLEAVAQLVREGKAKRIVAMTGAGISTAAGIPDFRSPGTGLYANLQRLNLPYAEAVFSIDYFRQNPKPFYVLAKELYPGQFHPTVSHAFLALLVQKHLLHMLFTQNIDCLERTAGVPADRIVEAHGSFATQRCIDCGAEFPDDEMKEYVKEAKVPRCCGKAGADSGCGGLVKPDIVFFGENLPARFHALRNVPATDADLVLVLGTSLTVYPFAGLPTLAADGVPRVLFNRELVGDFGTRADDVLELGSCDAGVRKLASALGWGEELEAFWRKLVGDAEADRQLGQDVLLAAAREEEDSSEEEREEQNTIAPAVAVPIAASKEEERDEASVGSTRPAAEDEVNEIANEIEAVLSLEEKPTSKTAGTLDGTSSLSREAQEAVTGSKEAPKDASTAAQASSTKDTAKTEDTDEPNETTPEKDKI